MFKFTIRELLLLIVIVAVGWWVRECLLQQQLDQAQCWRTRAGALERFLNPEWEIEWHLPSNAVILHDSRRPGHAVTIPIDLSKPNSRGP